MCWAYRPIAVCPIGIALMVSLRRSFQGIAQWRTLACFGLAIVGVLAAPHILQVYYADLTNLREVQGGHPSGGGWLYPDHFLLRLFDWAVGTRDRVIGPGYVKGGMYLRYWIDTALHDFELYEGPLPHTYVLVPLLVVLRCGAVSCAFGVIMIAGLAAIFARVPRWAVTIAGIVSAFAIGAASAVALGLYQTSIFIVYDNVGDIFRSLWSYPGLMLAETAWSASIFGLLGYGLAVTLPNRPQRSLEQIY
jgi:hypothetical protein